MLCFYYLSCSSVALMKLGDINTIESLGLFRDLHHTQLWNVFWRTRLWPKHVSYDLSCSAIPLFYLAGEFKRKCQWLHTKLSHSPFLTGSLTQRTFTNISTKILSKREQEKGVWSCNTIRKKLSQDVAKFYKIFASSVWNKGIVLTNVLWLWKMCYQLLRRSVWSSCQAGLVPTAQMYNKLTCFINEPFERVLNNLVYAWKSVLLLKWRGKNKQFSLCL